MRILYALSVATVVSACNPNPVHNSMVTVDIDYSALTTAAGVCNLASRVELFGGITLALADFQCSEMNGVAHYEVDHLLNQREGLMPAAYVDTLDSQFFPPITRTRVGPVGETGDLWAVMLTIPAGTCGDAVDNDGNGMTDCADPSCMKLQMLGALSCARCGDGHLDPGEQCDDGNTIDTDGCHNDCTLPSGPPAGTIETFSVFDSPGHLTVASSGLTGFAAKLFTSTQIWDLSHDAGNTVTRSISVSDGSFSVGQVLPIAGGDRPGLAIRWGATGADAAHLVTITEAGKNRTFSAVRQLASGDAELGGTRVDATTGVDLVVDTFDATTNTLTLGHTFPLAGVQTPVAFTRGDVLLANDSTGNVLAVNPAGSTLTTLAFGGGVSLIAFDAASGVGVGTAGPNLLVSRFNADGTVALAKMFAIAGTQSVIGQAVSAQGTSVIVSGTAYPSLGYAQSFVMALDATTLTQLGTTTMMSLTAGPLVAGAQQPTSSTATDLWLVASSSQSTVYHFGVGGDAVIATCTPYPFTFPTTPPAVTPTVLTVTSTPTTLTSVSDPGSVAAATQTPTTSTLAVSTVCQ